MSQTEILYILELKIPDEDSQRITVQGKTTVGSSPDATICLRDYGLAPLHCNFRDNNEILTVQNTGGDGAVIVGKQKLGHGKMYIVDKGDVVKLGEITFVIRTEEAEVHFVDNEGHTFVGDVEEDDDQEDEDDKPTKSIFAKLGGIFGKNKKLTEDETISGSDDNDGPRFDVIDHSEEESDDDDDSTAPRQIRASGSAIGKLKPKKVRVSPFLKNVRAGVLVRLAGFAIDLALVYSIYLYLLPQLKVEGHFQKAFDLIAPHMDKYLPLVKPHIPENILVTLTSFTTLKILFILFVFILASNILLGANAGLFLLGATGHGGFIGKRIKSLIRTLIGFVTTPFLIFDLPVILKKRTLKEVLSHSQIEKRSNFLSFVLTLLITPIILLGAFLWPLVNDPILLEMPEFEVAAKTSPKSKKKREFNYIAMSRHFNMKFAFFKKKTLEFIPSFEKTGLRLNAIDTKRGSKVSIFYSKEIDLNPEFKSMLEKNPFFPSFSPELYKFMAEEKGTKLITTELSNIIRDSMGLTPARIHEVLLEHGPYINGLMEVRLKLIKALGITNKFKVTAFTVSRRDSLLIEEESTDKLQRAYIIPLGAMKVTPLVFQFEARHRAFASSIIQNVFMKAGRLPKAFEFDPSQVEAWSSFSVIDLFNSENKENISEEVVASVVSYYESKIEILKAPEGVSAKAKRSYERLIRSSLKKTSDRLKGSLLSFELAKLMEQLPDKKVKK